MHAYPPIRARSREHVVYIELQQDSPCLLPCKHVICVWQRKSRFTMIADMQGLRHAGAWAQVEHIWADVSDDRYTQSPSSESSICCIRISAHHARCCCSCYCCAVRLMPSCVSVFTSARVVPEVSAFILCKASCCAALLACGPLAHHALATS